MIAYKCAACHTKLETDDGLGGRTEPCPACWAVNLVAAKPTKAAKPATSSRISRPWLLVMAAVVLIGGATTAFFAFGGYGLWDAAPTIIVRGEGATSRNAPTEKLPEPALPKETVAEEGRKALAAMLRLDAKTEVGMTRARFTEELGDAWATARPYLDSEKAKSTPMFAELLRQAQGQYELSVTCWDLKIEGGGPSSLMYHAKASWARASLYLMNAQAIADGADCCDPARVAAIERSIQVCLLYAANDPNAEPAWAERTKKEAKRWAEFKRWEALDAAKDGNAVYPLAEPSGNPMPRR